MGKINRGILGGFSGKVGTVIGGFWNGIQYMRAVPQNVRDAKSPGQMRQRQRLKLLSTLVKQFNTFVQIAFENNRQGQTSGNLAYSYNLKNAFSGDYPDQEIAYDQLRVAQGGLTGALNASVDAIEEGEVTFSWSDNSTNGNAGPDDRVMLLLINADKQESVFDTQGPKRDESSATLTIPDSYSGDKLHAYIAFRNSDRGTVSNSTYLGTVTAT